VKREVFPIAARAGCAPAALSWGAALRQRLEERPQDPLPAGHRAREERRDVPVVSVPLHATVLRAQVRDAVQLEERPHLRSQPHVPCHEELIVVPHDAKHLERELFRAPGEPHIDAREIVEGLDLLDGIFEVDVVGVEGPERVDKREILGGDLSEGGEDGISERGHWGHLTPKERRRRPEPRLAWTGPEASHVFCRLSWSAKQGSDTRRAITMRLLRVQLQNFRAFEEVELDLDERLTVLVGRNATGKTTLLEGIAVALGAWVGAFPDIREEHPRVGTIARLKTSVQNGVPVTEIASPVRVMVSCEIAGASMRLGRDLGTDGWHDAEDSPSSRPLKDIVKGVLLPQTPQTLPVVASYGTGRVWQQKRERRSERSGLTSRFRGYHSALDAAADARGFASWMAWREEDRVQRLARAAEEGRSLTEVRSPELEAVSAAACGCLENARRLYHSANYQELRVDFHDGSTIPFSALSDGQRNLIAVAADIAWRASQLNPHLGPEAPTKTPGVVLIDEIDLHLHPAWQRRVLGDLVRIFPLVQFVVTTHSPQVLSTAPAGSVRLIGADHGVSRVERTTGKDSNSLLEDVLDVPARPEEQQRKLEELGRLLEEGRIAEARAVLADLAVVLGEDDTQVAAARWEIALAEAPHAAD